MYENIEELLTAHGIKYQKKGNVIKCLCPNPNHNDKHIGSFSFDLMKGLGHCFACGCSVNIKNCEEIIFAVNFLVCFNCPNIYIILYLIYLCQ